MAGTNPNQPTNPMGQANDPGMNNPQSANPMGMQNPADPNAQMAQPVMPPMANQQADPMAAGTTDQPGFINPGMPATPMMGNDTGMNTNQGQMINQPQDESVMQPASVDPVVPMMGADSPAPAMPTAEPTPMPTISDTPVKATIEEDNTASMTPAATDTNQPMETETATLTSQSPVADPINIEQPVINNTQQDVSATPTDLDSQMQQSANDITDGSSDNTPMMGADPMAANADAPVAPMGDSSAPTQSVEPVAPVDPMQGVVEIPGPEFDQSASPSDPSVMGTGDVAMNPMSQDMPAANNQMNAVMGSDQSAPAAPDMNAQNAAPTGQQMQAPAGQPSPGLNVVEDMGGLPPMASPESGEIPGQEKGGSKKGMIILVAGILIIGVILFLVGVLLASGGNLPF